MDISYQLYMFILSITTLFKDIKPTGNFSHNWFHAQKQCLDHGLIIEKNKSDQPYWTGVYRRLSPWINILGCYSDFIESQPEIVKNTIIISSVGMCQEICHHKNINQFAVKMNKCVCIEIDIRLSPVNRLSPSACNYKCEDNSDDIYSGDCGGERAYNIYETQGVHFNSVEICLSLQCSVADPRFRPNKCFELLDKVCENKTSPLSYASSWSLSMEQCKRYQPSTYLLGNINLNNPHLVCERIQPQFIVIWIGVARQKYKSIDQGWEIKEKQRETYLECQMCANDDYQFVHCSDLLTSSIFCRNISGTFQGKTTSQKTFSPSTLKSNHSTSEEMFASRSSTGNYDQDQLSSTKESLSGASEDLVLKISLPLTVGFITLFVCVVGVVLYKRRSKMTKTDRTTKAEVKTIPEKNAYSELDFSQSNSSFALEHCYQKISKGSSSLSETPYYNSEEGVNDHIKDKQAQGTELNNIYQNAQQM